MSEAYESDNDRSGDEGGDNYPNENESPAQEGPTFASISASHESDGEESAGSQPPNQKKIAAVSTRTSPSKKQPKPDLKLVLAETKKRRRRADSPPRRPLKRARSDYTKKRGSPHQPGKRGGDSHQGRRKAYTHYERNPHGRYRGDYHGERSHYSWDHYGDRGYDPRDVRYRARYHHQDTAYDREAGYHLDRRGYQGQQDRYESRNRHKEFNHHDQHHYDHRQEYRGYRGQDQYAYAPQDTYGHNSRYPSGHAWVSFE